MRPTTAGARALGAALVASLALLVGPASLPAGAADITGVSDEAEYRAALADASIQGAGTHTIHLDADFTITDPGTAGDPEYSGSGDLIIDGHGHTVDAGVENVKFVLATGGTLTVTDVTIDGFSHTALSDIGAAIRSSGPLALDGVTIVRCAWTFDGDVGSITLGAAGSAVYSTSTLSISDSSFIDNTLDVRLYSATGSVSISWRGGIVSASSAVTVDGSTFDGNDAFVRTESGDSTAAATLAGGILEAVGGGLTIADSTFSDNTVGATSVALTNLSRATITGGVTSSRNGDTTVTGSELIGNSVTASAESDDEAWATIEGGVIHTDGGAVDISTSSFSDNLAISTTPGSAAATDVEVIGRGGVVYTDDGTLDVEDSDFDGNQLRCLGTVGGESLVECHGSALFVGDLASVGGDVDESTFTDNATLCTARSSTDAADAQCTGAVALHSDGNAVLKSAFTDNSVSALVSGATGTSGSVSGGAVSADQFDTHASVFSNSTYSGNSATATVPDGAGSVDGLYVFGGAIDSGDSANDFFVFNTTFAGNAASLDAGDVEVNGDVEVRGGALDSGVYSSTLRSSTFDGNSATGTFGSLTGAGDVLVAGGAVANDSDEIAPETTTFEDNTATATFEGDVPAAVGVLVAGGAIFNERGSTDVTTSIFRTNTATLATDGATSDVAGEVHGGAIGHGPYDATTQTVTVSQSLLEGNVATIDADGVDGNFEGYVYGGAIYATDDVSVTNTTLTENVASRSASGVTGFTDIVTRAGGIATYDADVTAAHATFVGNVAPIHDHVFPQLGTFYPEASVFADAGSDTACTNVSSAGNNFDDDGDCTVAYAGTGDFGFGDDPGLGAVAPNGGYAPSMQPVATSPLVDYYTTCASPEDQRGISRPQGADCDLGAVERIDDVSFVIPTDGDDIVGTAAGSDCAAYDIGWTATADFVPAPPADVVVPYGVSDYTLCVPQDGGSVAVTLELPGPVATAFKVVGSEWLEIPGVAAAGATITFNIQDGGPLDQDGIANGVIVDPVAGGFVLSFTG